MRLGDVKVKSQGGTNCVNNQRAIDVLRGLENALADVMPTGVVLVEPDEIATATQLFKRQIIKQPLAVARCASTEDVQGAVRAGRAAAIPMSVFVAGHDMASGSSVRDGGLVIDLTPMRQVDIVGETAIVGGGATSQDLLDAAATRGLSPVVGTIGSVGVAGMTLGGGYGRLIGRAGLSIDNLVSAEVVLADGVVVTVDCDHEPDLFWALRGGGGNFGIVTQLVTQLVPVSKVTTGTIAFPFEQAFSVVDGLRTLIAHADDSLDVGFGVITTPVGRVVFTHPTWCGDAEQSEIQIAQVRALGDPVIDRIERISLADATRATPFPRTNYCFGSRILPPLTSESVQTLVAAAERMPDTCSVNVRHARGAATRVPVQATAHAYREEHCIVDLQGQWEQGDGAAETTWVEEAERLLDRHALAGGWAIRMNTDDARAQDAFGPNTERLLQIKRRYDPDGVFCATPIPS
jgi:FAD binding domain/Berberine and berberine like